MKNKIRKSFVLFLTIPVVALCSCQKRERTEGLPIENAAKSDSTKFEMSQSAETQAPLVTFVELGSVNCIPCKMMQPIMREIETEYAGQVKVVFHDVWTEQGRPFAEQYRIRVIPTQVFLDQNGEEYFRHEGYFPKAELVQVLKQKGVK